MSNLKKPINYKMLENELDEALRADELYKLQNDAKIRAIEQRVPTYDHFRGMVQAAHLRPLERAEMQRKAEVSWNHCVNKNEKDLDLYQPTTNSFILKSNDVCSNSTSSASELQTTAEFFKFWKNSPDSKTKFEHLLQIKDSLKNKFFKVEVPPHFLEELFKLSLEICSVDTVIDVIDVLKICSECNRFSLSLAMVSVQEKYFLELLFTKLLSIEHKDVNIDELKDLMKTYCVSFTD